MSFVAQLDFGSLAALEDPDPRLPQEGLLALFFDVKEMMWNWSDADFSSRWRIIYEPDVQALVARDPPETLLRKIIRRASIAPRSLDFGWTDRTSESCHCILGPAEWSDPPWGGEPFLDPRIKIAFTETDRTYDLDRLKLDGLLKLEAGGVDVVRIAKEAQEWILLWQIDSDEKAGVSWVDAGTLFLLVRAADLENRRFDRVRCVIESS